MPMDAGDRSTAPIDLDCTNVLEQIVGASNGLNSDELEEWVPRLEESVRQLRWSVPGFLDRPDEEDLLDQVRRAESTLDGIEQIVVLGIGGSALGPRAIFETAWGPHALARVGMPDGPTRALHIADNIDPDGFGQLLRSLDLGKTLFNVISKSGSTVETMAQLTIAWRRVRETLGEAETPRHFVFTTDPVSGFLRDLGQRFGVAMLDIPRDVGGRFSVLSPVGLFPAMATGVDPQLLLDGARSMNPRCLTEEIEQNPAAVLALIHFLLDRLKGKHIAVMMPYSDRLRTFAEWFAQLWAESLGKTHAPTGELKSPVGQTPVRALGTTDQHSQIQLFVEGPNDKMITLLTVDELGEDLALGAPGITDDGSGLEYLEGHTLGEVFEIEQVATEMALARALRPTLIWRLPAVSPHVLGQLFQVYGIACALAGSLYHVDPYNQPGVEEGKNLTYGSLGRSGYEAKGLEMSSYRARKEKWIIGGLTEQTGGEEE